MVDDLRTQPDRDRVAELIAAADRLATPRDFEIIDRRPIRRGGVIARPIVVACVLLGLISITTLGGGSDATADDRINTTTAAPAAAPAVVAPISGSGERTSGSANPAAAVSTSFGRSGDDRCHSDDEPDHQRIDHTD